jgi:hypothetical protein
MELWAIIGLIFFVPISLHIQKLVKKNIHIEYWKLLIYVASGILALTSKESMLFLAIVPIFFLYVSRSNDNLTFQLCNLIIIFVAIYISKV